MLYDTLICLAYINDDISFDNYNDKEKKSVNSHII